MKQIKKTPFYLLLLLSLNACSKEFPCSTMEDHFMAYSYKPNAIKKSNIKSRNRIDFSKGEQDIYVISPNIPSKKVDRIEYFNDDGYLILVVEPIYKMGKTDTTGYSNLPYLEQLVFVQEVETNAPTGQVDSIIFSYNSKNIIKRLEKRKQNLLGISYAYSIETYEYDNKNNLIKICISSDYGPTNCRSTTFKYDEKGKIISETTKWQGDILSPEEPEQNEYIYSYYEDGKLKSSGNQNFLYENGRLKESYTEINNTKVSILKYQYDIAGNIVDMLGISVDHLNEIQNAKKNDTTSYRSIYDERQLITEIYRKSNYSKKSYNLYKYEYE